MLDIDLGILSKIISFTRNDKEIILRQICEYLPEFTPQKYGYGAKYSNIFELDNIESALDFWDLEGEFYWRRLKPKVEGSIHTDYAAIHSSIFLNASCKPLLDLTKLVKYFLEASLCFSSDFSYLHLFSKQELEVQDYEMCMPFRQGVVTHQLRRYLPNLCWANIFGTSYIELFGRETLLSTPAFLVSEISKNIIYLQLTEDIYDLKTNYLEVDGVRQKAKRHLDNNIFFNSIHNKNHKYNTPKFPLEVPSSAGRTALDNLIETVNRKASGDFVPRSQSTELNSLIDNLENQFKN
jgi:hypothetical protein